MDIETMDPKQKALLALTVATRAFFSALQEELRQRFPGREEESRALLDDGKAHLCISVQVGSGQIKAALQLVQPEFYETLSAPDLRLSGSLASVFGDPSEVKIVDLGKLN